jgi:hypothetical protein
MTTKKQVPGTYTVTIAFSVQDIGSDTEALDGLLGQAIEAIENTTGAVALMPRAVGGVEQFDTDTGLGFHYHAVEDVNDPDFGEWRALYGGIVAGEDTVECDRDGCHERLEGNEPAVPIVCWHCFKAEVMAERLKNGAQETLQAENAELKRELAEAEVLAQRICREAGVVLFGNGEVRNHRAEAAEKERDTLKARLQDAEASVKLGEAVVERVERKAAQLEAALRQMVLVTATFVHKVAVHDARISAEKALAALPSPANPEDTIHGRRVDGPPDDLGPRETWAAQEAELAAQKARRTPPAEAGENPDGDYSAWAKERGLTGKMRPLESNAPAAPSDAKAGERP